MEAAELLEAKVRAELEMFYLMTVEEGATYLAWCEATERPWRASPSFSASYTRLESQAQARTGKRGA